MNDDRRGLRRACRVGLGMGGKCAEHGAKEDGSLHVRAFLDFFAAPGGMTLNQFSASAFMTKPL